MILDAVKIFNSPMEDIALCGLLLSYWGWVGLIG